MRFLFLIFLLISNLSWADSEATFSGKTAQAHIIQASGDSLRPRPYLDFEGCSGADLNGKTVITCSGGGSGGSMTWPSGGAGIPNYSGSNSWGTTYSVKGNSSTVQLEKGTLVSGNLLQSDSNFNDIDSGIGAASIDTLLAVQTQNKFFASPNGSSGTGSYRAIVVADVPTLNQNTSGNAATVTTNANMTGDVISSGSNATTVAKIAGVAVGTPTGTTNVVFSNSPTLVTPTLGASSATTINKVTITAPASGSTLTIADGKTLTINNTLTLAGKDSTTHTFPNTSDTVVEIGFAQTLSNKRIVKRTVATSDATSISINADTCDVVIQINSQSTGTLTINNPSGTPNDEDQLQYRIKTTNAQTYAWGNNFATGPVVLPTISTIGKTDKIAFFRDNTAGKWESAAYGTY